jgi:alpha-tubulin suppressor-like RCC1 family protein
MTCACKQLPQLEFTRLDVFGVAMPAVMAACGAEHTIVLTAAGDVWVFGGGEQVCIDAEQGLCIRISGSLVRVEDDGRSGGWEGQ